MVEITYQMALSTLQTIGLLVGIAYYLFIMRNSQRNQELALKAQEHALETRETQLFMNIFNTYSSGDFIEAHSGFECTPMCSRLRSRDSFSVRLRIH